MTPPAGSGPGEFPGVPELTDTPFYPQERYQCGPAALQTALVASGVASELDDLVRRVYLPARQGSLQAELLAATRAAGRIPYRIDGTLAAVAAELQAGRPVLVLQNLGVSLLPRWHYAVIVGLDAERGEVLLRSGTEPRRRTGLRRFLNTWSRSGYWGFVVVRPDEMPVNPDRDRWFRSIAAVEQVGETAVALTAWAGAVRRWPDSVVAQFGLANGEYQAGNWQAAEEGYQRILARQPALAIARNNLALCLMHQERYAAAEREARRALADAGSDISLRAEIEATLDSILGAQPRSGRPSSTSR